MVYLCSIHCYTKAKTLPEHVKDLPVWLYPEEDVGNGDVLELSLLRVGKVDLRLPDSLDQVGVVEVQGLLDGRVVQAGILPVLSQVQVHLVVLAREKAGIMM